MNLTKCTILFLLYLVFMVLHHFNLDHLETKSEKFYKKTENYKKVQDLLHDVLPHVDYLNYAPDFLLILVFAYMALMNYKLIYHFGGLVFSLILLRQLIIQITVLPKNDMCKIKTHTSIFRGGCYDKIFSGHFGIGFLMTLILYDNGLINKVSAVFINFLNALFILLTRSHYTIDIVVSIFAVIIIYQNNLNICNLLNKHF